MLCMGPTFDIWVSLVFKKYIPQTKVFLAKKFPVYLLCTFSEDDKPE